MEILFFFTGVFKCKTAELGVGEHRACAGQGNEKSAQVTWVLQNPWGRDNYRGNYCFLNKQGFLPSKIPSFHCTRLERKQEMAQTPTFWLTAERNPMKGIL